VYSVCLAVCLTVCYGFSKPTISRSLVLSILALDFIFRDFWVENDAEIGMGLNI
jgi:hypothetical protein